MTARTTASRHLAATVAQYIHELSERHAQERAVAVAARARSRQVAPATATALGRGSGEPGRFRPVRDTAENEYGKRG